MQVYFTALSAAIEYVRAGKLPALAVTTATRSPALPNVPTMGEFLRGYEATNWWGIVAPRSTSTEIVQKLNMEINAGLVDSKLKARMADFGGTPLVLSPPEFGRFVVDETEKWAKVVRAANIKAE